MSLLGPRTSICVRRVGSSFPPRQGNYRYAVIGSHNGGLAIFLYVLSLIAAAQIKEGKFESLVGAFRFCGGDHGESRSCRLESAKALLKENPDLVSYKDNYGGTALHRASEYGLKDLAEFLLANQADVNAKTKGGHTPLHYTAGYGQRDLGAGRNRADFAELLLSNHADVNARDNAGATPLHYAADRLKAIAELLLASNANIDAKDSNGMTPLHVAAGFGRRAEVELLLVKGADVDAKDNNGRTALHLAVAGFATGEEVHGISGGKRGDPVVAGMLRDHGGHE
jgi:ankyrin repeat protein